MKTLIETPPETFLETSTESHLETPKIIIVAGLPGVGKTRWIQEQIQQKADQKLSDRKLNQGNNPEIDPDETAVYLNLGQGVAPIDAVYLAAEVAGLKILAEEQLNEFIYHLSQTDLIQDTLYLELGFSIDPTSLVLPLDESLYQRVAVVSPEANQEANQSLWQGWADAIVPGTPHVSYDQQPQISRSVLTGQVIDGSSLETFWYELVHGAYGNVQRAKGIFTPVDGRILHFDFVAGLPETIATELPLSPCIKGRPEQFSGIEIVGLNLDQAAIAQTLGDSCLDDQAIAYYQEQIQEQLTQI